MGYKLSGQCPYFAVPYEVLDDSAFGNLSPTACKMLVFLYAAMNQRSAPGVRISSSQLAEALHVNETTVRNARRDLEAAGAIRCTGGKGGAVFEIRTINPRTSQPFPPEKGRPEIADWKPRRSRIATPEAEPQAGPARVGTTPLPPLPVRTLAPIAPRVAQAEPEPAAPLSTPPAPLVDSWRCRTCGCRSHWQHPGGSQRNCGECHPQPISQGCGAVIAKIEPGAVDSPLTEHGLPLPW
jgi:Bacterial regulatory proteins, gntR family